MYKRALLSVLSGIFFLFLFLPSVEARPMTPGVDCGYADPVEHRIDRCCYNKTQKLPRLPGQSILQHVPVIGKPIKRYGEVSENLEKFQDNHSNVVPCTMGEADRDPSEDGCTCVEVPEQTLGFNSNLETSLDQLCKNYQFSGADELSKCTSCVQKRGYWSGIGCVPLDMQHFITDYIFRIGISFAGMFALICIIYSSIRIQISRGNPETIQNARERLTSCIIGLILIIFSVFILQFIGVKIFGIPGFG